MGSKYHFFIFWGFLVITIGSVETLIQGLFPSFSLALVLGGTLARRSTPASTSSAGWSWSSSASRSSGGSSCSRA